MKTVMLGYWVILVGVVLNIVGSIWDAADDLLGEEAFGGLTPERLKFLGIRDLGAAPLPLFTEMPRRGVLGNLGRY